MQTTIDTRKGSKQARKEDEEGGREGGRAEACRHKCMGLAVPRRPGTQRWCVGHA